MKPLSGGLTRRRLVATSAWSVPLAVVASPAPAYAASCRPVVTILTSSEARVKACTATYSSEDRAPVVP